MSLWDALRMNMMISYQELVRTFPNSSFQSEIPKARINLKLDLHTGGASKKTELPLKLLVAGDFSNGQESAPCLSAKKLI